MLFLFVYILLNKAKLKRQLYYLKICCAPHVNLIFLNYFASHFQFIYHCSWIMCYCMFSLWFSSCLITSTFLQWKRCHSTKRHNNYLKDEMKNEGIKSCLREIRSFSRISQQGSLFFLVWRIEIMETPVVLIYCMQERKSCHITYCRKQGNLGITLHYQHI